MEIVIAAVLVALGLVFAAALVTKRAPAAATANGRPKATLPPTRADAPTANGHTEAARLEERLRAREVALDTRAAELGERERRVAHAEAELTEVRERTIRELERASGLSASQAKALLLKELEDQVRHESA